MTQTIRILLLACVGIAGAQQGRDVFDGHRWRSSAPDERNGFVDGYGDCHVHDLHGDQRFDAPTESYSLALTEYYETHPTELGRSVDEVLLFVSKNVVAPGRSTDTTNTGFDEGMLWLNYSPAARSSFVSGYLACYAHKRIKDATFSKRPEEYARLISTWYGVDKLDRDPSLQLDDRARKKIAAVLYMFGDEKRAK